MERWELMCCADDNENLRHSEKGRETLNMAKGSLGGKLFPWGGARELGKMGTVEIC